MPRWAVFLIVVLIIVDQVTKRVMLALVFDPPAHDRGDRVFQSCSCLELRGQLRIARKF